MANISELQTEPRLPRVQIVQRGIYDPGRRGISWQLARFGIVGVSNVTVDLLVLNILLLMSPTKSTLLVLLYNSTAYACGAVNSFMLNKYWTFCQTRHVTTGEVFRFVVVNTVGILCNDALLALATHILSLVGNTSLLWTNIAKLCAVVGTATISYGGMRLWVFAGRAEARSEYRIRKVTEPQRDSEVKKDCEPEQMYDEKVLLTRRSLSVILPAYNESGIIGSTIQQVVSTLENWVEDLEVIVVDDGSSDQTKVIVEEIAEHDVRVRLVHHSVNQGYGAALISGFAAARKELTFFMDADGQFDIHDLTGFFHLIEYYDAVLGYRLERQDSWLRLLNAWGWKWLVTLLLGLRVRDIDCAFKLYHTEFLQQTPLETRGAMINAEMLYKLKRSGRSYVQRAVRHFPRTSGRATGAKPGVILRALRELLFYAYKWRCETRKPLSRIAERASITMIMQGKEHEDAE